MADGVAAVSHIEGLLNPSPRPGAIDRSHF